MAFFNHKEQSKLVRDNKSPVAETPTAGYNRPCRWSIHEVAVSEDIVHDRRKVGL